MGKEVTFDYSKTAGFISAEEVKNMKAGVECAKEVLTSRTGAGNDFLGWIDLPVDYDKDEFARIKKAAAKIQSDSDVLLVIGIGGSYLGARAAIEFLTHSFYNVLDKGTRKTPQIFFVGNSISSKYIKDLQDVVRDKDFSINIISKSGTTTEPAIAFRVFKEMLIEKYGKEEANKRIYATTDKAKGALKNLANQEGYESFVVPDDVGGRFSVLTAVGLLPIAVSGADIDKLMEGAAFGRKKAYTMHDIGARGMPDLSYHGRKAWYGDFEGGSRHVGILYAGCHTGGETLYVICNMHTTSQELALPTLPSGEFWRVIADTGCEGQCFFPEGREPELAGEKTVKVAPRTIVIMAGKKHETD